MANLATARNTIKDSIQSKIRAKTQPKSLLNTDHADTEDEILLSAGLSRLTLSANTTINAANQIIYFGKIIEITGGATVTIASDVSDDFVVSFFATAQNATVNDPTNGNTTVDFQKSLYHIVRLSAGGFRVIIDIEGMSADGTSAIELTDNFVIGTNSDNGDLLYYTGATDITVTIAAGLADGFRTEIKVLGAGSVDINATIAGVQGTTLSGGSISRRGFILKKGATFYGEGQFTTGLTGAATFLSARVDSGSSNTNKLTVKFTNEVNNIDADDFLIFGTHCKINTTVTPTTATVSDGFEVTFTLDDHVLPDDILQVYYFMPAGILTDASNGNYVSSFIESVSNFSSTYNGSKTVSYITTAQGVADIKTAIGADKIVAIQRGGTYGNVSTGDVGINVSANNCYITAYGSGDRPKLYLQESSADPFGGIGANGFSGIRICNIDFTFFSCDGIKFRGNCPFAFVSTCKIRGSGNMANDKAIDFYHNTGSSAVKPEGSWAINNDIDLFEDGIFHKLYNVDSPVAVSVRQLGGAQTPVRIEYNKVRTLAYGGSEGDAINMSRGEFFGSVIRNNEISGWCDDGIDCFGLRGGIVEYNWLHNENTNAQMQTGNVGRGIKMGGEGGGSPGNDDISGNNIFRYNVVSKLQEVKTDGALSDNAFGLVTNGGGSVGTTKVYGNICYGVGRGALKFDGASNGTKWQFFNNVLLDGSDRSIATFGASNLASIFFRNNIFGSINFNVDGNYNILVSGYTRTNYVSGPNDISGVALSVIFSDTANLRTSAILPISPSINTGQAIADWQRDIKGNNIVGTTDIGATEYQG